MPKFAPVSQLLKVSAAVAFCVCSTQAAYAVTAGSSFDVETEILGLDIGLTSLDVTLNQSGTTQVAADPDVALAIVGVDVSTGYSVLPSVSANLGILGVEWIDNNTFDLVFGLEGLTITLPLVGEVGLGISTVPTVDWVLSGLIFDDPTAVITGVTQVVNGGITVSPGGITWTDNSISITTNSLVNAGLNFNARSQFTLTSASPPPAVPLPAAGLLLVGGLGGLATLRARRARKA